MGRSLGTIAGVVAGTVIAVLAGACGNGSNGGSPGTSGDAAADVVAPGDAADGGGAADAPGLDGTSAEAATPLPLPALPLKTTSRWIVDANGKRFKLASVNWYGAESKDFVVAGLDKAALGDVAHAIRALGFNSVRLPWSNEMFETNPLVDPARLSANPSLAGGHALDVFDAVVGALAFEGLVVILDNHRSHADWCCDLEHGDGLWYAPGYPETSWVADWQGMVRRYLAEPAVVGADLRNELRQTFDPSAPSTCTACGSGCACLTPVWDGSGSNVDWMTAARTGGEAVLSVNPSLLVLVEGVNYALDLTGVYAHPLALSVPGRLVYSAHDYVFSHAPYTTYAAMKTDLGNAWGYILTQNQPYTAPVWVGEFGTDHTSPSNVNGTTGAGFWFESFRQYLTDADIDWSYWAINGTEATGYSRTLGAEETYGVLDTSWSAPALVDLVDALQAIQPATQGP
jgi:endoglucanase